MPKAGKQTHRRKAPAAAAASGPAQLGDVVVWMSSNGQQTLGPGRYCADVGAGIVCVRFEDPIGCRRVGFVNLSLSSDPNAPDCTPDCAAC